MKEHQFNKTMKMQLEVMNGTRTMQLQDLRESRLNNLFAGSPLASPPRRKYVLIVCRTCRSGIGAPSVLRGGPRIGLTSRRTRRRA